MTSQHIGSGTAASANGAAFAPLRDATAIAGVGYSPFTKRSGVSPLALAVTAVRDAVADAGLTLADIDGVATHHVNESASPHQVAAALGLSPLSWSLEELGGGSRAAAVVGGAAMACAAGAARHVVVYRALNGRSGTRMGGSTGRSAYVRPEVAFQEPYGLLSPSQSYALGARMHMNRFGTTEEQLGRIAVQQRANAVLNPRAVERTPMTLDDYFAARWITEPFRLYDCCLETDAACAVVVTTTERARDLRRHAVTIRAFASTAGPDGFGRGANDLTTSAAAHAAKLLYERAGLGPEEVDVAELYDAFTFSALLLMEDFGFCGKGEGGPFVESGATALAGALPVNTHGGFLSEGYVHGLNHIAEAVQQLRHDAGERQVAGFETALATAQPGYLTGVSSAILLRRS